MHECDEPGQGVAGAGLSPTDPGAPSDESSTDAEEELVRAVEDLVSDMFPDQDACAP